MDHYEQQREAFRRRNERNKIRLKRCKIYYIGIVVPWIAEIVLLLAYMSGMKEWSETVLYVFLGITFALLIGWALWIVIGAYYIRCPHCDSMLYRVPVSVRCCPYCGTVLHVYPDLEKPEERI